MEITVGYCAGLEPSWLAFQDGSGEWTQAQPVTSGGITAFRHSFASDRGAIATLTRLGGDGLTSLFVLYGTPAELAIVSETNPQFCGPLGSKSWSGTVAGLSANETAFVTAGFGELPRNTFGNSFEMGDIPSEPIDLFATRTTRSNEGSAITSVIVRRNLDLPDGAQIPVLDFASPEAFPPAIATVTLSGLGADGALAGTRIHTLNGESVVFFPTVQTTQATRQYFALPEARLLSGDLQHLVSTSRATVGNGARGAELYFRSPGDRTLAYGEPIIEPSFSTVAGGPSLRFRARFVSQIDYNQSASVSYQQGHLTLVSVFMTGAYAAISGAGYDLVVPDLSGASGFDPATALKASGGQVLWSATRIGGTLPLSFDAVPSDGMTRRNASTNGTIPSP